MRFLKQILGLALWFALWMAIPAAALYPVALWMSKHTQISEDSIVNGYFFAVAVLFFPTAMLVDFVYRRLRYERAAKQPGQRD